MAPAEPFGDPSATASDDVRHADGIGTVLEEVVVDDGVAGTCVVLEPVPECVVVGTATVVVVDDELELPQAASPTASTAAAATAPRPARRCRRGDGHGGFTPSSSSFAGRVARTVPSRSGPRRRTRLRRTTGNDSIAGMDDDPGALRPDLRALALAELQQLLDAAVDLREDLAGHIVACDAIIDGVRREERLFEVMESVDSRTWRPRLTDSLTAYERLRHRARLRLIALGRSEGMSVDDVEHLWSITRQLANRSIRESERLE